MKVKACGRAHWAGIMLQRMFRGTLLCRSFQPGLKRRAWNGSKSKSETSGGKTNYSSVFMWAGGAVIAGGAGMAFAPADDLPQEPVERLRIRASAVSRASLAFGVCGLVVADYKISLFGMDHSTEGYREALSRCHKCVSLPCSFLPLVTELSTVSEIRFHSTNFWCIPADFHRALGRPLLSATIANMEQPHASQIPKIYLCRRSLTEQTVKVLTVC